MLYEAMHAIVPPVARAVWRPVVEGVDNVPATGPVILASNHLSFVDSVVIPVVTPRKVVFLAKEEYFNTPGLRGRLSKAWFAGLGMVLPQAIAGAMTPFPERAGAASALLGFVQQSTAALCGALVGVLLGSTAWPLAGMIAAMGCATLALWVATRAVRGRAVKP